MAVGIPIGFTSAPIGLHLHHFLLDFNLFFFASWCVFRKLPCKLQTAHFGETTRNAAQLLKFRAFRSQLVTDGESSIASDRQRMR